MVGKVGVEGVGHAPKAGGAGDMRPRPDAVGGDTRLVFTWARISQHVAGPLYKIPIGPTALVLSRATLPALIFNDMFRSTVGNTKGSRRSY